MPEGDTVKKLVLSRQEALLEEPLTRCHVRGVSYFCPRCQLLDAGAQPDRHKITLAPAA